MGFSLAPTQMKDASYGIMISIAAPLVVPQKMENWKNHGKIGYKHGSAYI